jgi:hypothetical protein
MAPKSARIRVSVISTVVLLSIGWVIFLFAKGTGMWQLCFLSLLFVLSGAAKDILREGYFHPLLIFLVFSSLYVIVDMIWMAGSIGGIILFFSSYEFYVDAHDFFVLVGEQMILITAAYVGYLFVRGISKRNIEFTTSQRSPIAPLWLAFYVLGIAALFYIVIASGGFAETLANLNEKGDRRSGRGLLYLLHYFAYAGILIWYYKNSFRPAWQRYGGILALATPLLLSGSRIGTFMCVVAAGYIDERSGKRINLIAGALFYLALAIVFARYQDFRGGEEQAQLLDAVYSDLSMGVGYMIAVQEGIVGNQVRLDILLIPLVTVLPHFIEDTFLLIPDSPNAVFTQFIFRGSNATFSMGVLGEANYALPFVWSSIWYFGIGATLTWIGSFGWKKSLLLAAVVAGGAVRLAKGGITAGAGNILQFAVPIVVGYLLVVVVLSMGVKKRVTRRA